MGSVKNFDTITTTANTISLLINLPSIECLIQYINVYINGDRTFNIVLYVMNCFGYRQFTRLVSVLSINCKLINL